MRKTISISTALFLILWLMTATAFAYLIKGSEREVDAASVRINGRMYVLLTDVCKAHGIEWGWDSIARKIFLRKEGREIVLLEGSKNYYDGKKIKTLSAAVCTKDGSIFVPLKFVKYNVKGLFDIDKRATQAAKTVSRAVPAKSQVTKVKSEKNFKIKKVAIDPGHGGKDPGAIGRMGLYEKDVVLEVSKRIKNELEKDGLAVVMTRSSDKFVPLGERAKIANENNCDFFISIHANANKRKWIRGFEVYYLSEATDDNARAIAAAENSVLEYEENSFARHTKNLDAIIWDLKFSEHREESIELAGFICQGVARELNPKNSCINSARFYVLKGAEMPSVLVELSYLSNKYDEKDLNRDSYRQKLAEGIAAGILDYKSEYERTNGFSH